MSDLSHIANSYVLAHRLSVSDQRSTRILNDLRRNPNVVILKPDKGNGVVILNRSDYDSGLLKIISDSTKFKPIKSRCQRKPCKPQRKGVSKNTSY